jgi:hypothetical protein
MVPPVPRVRELIPQREILVRRALLTQPRMHDERTPLVAHKTPAQRETGAIVARRAVLQLTASGLIRAAAHIGATGVSSAS